MAAIDPNAHIDQDESGDDAAPPRATLKIIRGPPESDDSDLDSDLDSDDASQIRALLRGAGDMEDDSEDEDDDGEDNAGPSDPSKSLKARKEQAAAELRKALEAEDIDMDDGLNVPNGVNGKPSAKARGKARATDVDSDDDEEDDSLDMEEFVLCTLDPARVWFLSISHGVATLIRFTSTAPALSAAVRYYRRRRRARLLQGVGHAYRLPDWELRRSRPWKRTAKAQRLLLGRRSRLRSRAL